MRYWWVNQNQTYKYEVPGGYMWSPFKNANRARNPFHDKMGKVQPENLIALEMQNPLVLHPWKIVDSTSFGADVIKQEKCLKFHPDMEFQV